MSAVTLKGFISSYQVVSLPVVIALIVWSLAPRIKRAIQAYLKNRQLYRKFLRPSVFDFDIVVIGGGSAGMFAAQTAARLKAKVVLIEKNKIDGNGLEVIEGEARILDPFRVEVAEKIFTTRNIIIATGAEPVLPELRGFKDITSYVPEAFWRLTELPKRVLVLGGGPVGCEIAQVCQRRGCETILVERRDAILQKIDQDMMELVLSRLKAEGLDVMTKTEITSFEKSGDGYKAFLASGGQIAFDIAIVALGCRPITRGLGIEDLNLVFRRDGTIETDEFTRTKFPNIFACGDVTGPFQIIHSAHHQAERAVMNALFAPLKYFKTDYTALPSVAYVEPEVARVGWSETEAFAAGLAYDVVRYPMGKEPGGVVKVLAEKDGGKILGATIVGIQAGAVIGKFVLAISKKMNLNETMNTPQAHSQQKLKYLEKLHAWRRG